MADFSRRSGAKVKRCSSFIRLPCNSATGRIRFDPSNIIKMSNALPTKPPPESNWPPTEEELAQHREESHQTAQQVSKWSPTDREFEASDDSLSSVPQEPHTTFQSSSSDDPLAQFGSEAVGADSAVAATGLSTAESSSPGLPRARLFRVALRTSDDESTYDATDRRWDADRMAVAGKTAMVDVDPPEGSLAIAGPVGVAFDHDTGLVASSTGRWGAEIERLQALLEELTEKIECRVTE